MTSFFRPYAVRTTHKLSSLNEHRKQARTAINSQHDYWHFSEGVSTQSQTILYAELFGSQKKQRWWFCLDLLHDPTIKQAVVTKLCYTNLWCIYLGYLIIAYRFSDQAIAHNHNSLINVGSVYYLIRQHSTIDTAFNWIYESKIYARALSISEW